MSDRIRAQLGMIKQATKYQHLIELIFLANSLPSCQALREKYFFHKKFPIH